MFTPEERRHGWSVSLIEGTIQGSVTALISSASPYMVPFALFLGADSWQLGLLAAVGPMAMVVAATLDALPWPRKQVAVWGAGICRYLWLVIAALPFLASDAHVTVPVFLATYAVVALVGQIGGLAWLDWMRDLIEPERRGTYFAWRGTLATVVTVVTVWVAGIWLDHQRLAGDERSGFIPLILAGVVMGVLGRWTLERQPDCPASAQAAAAVQAEPSERWHQFLTFIAVWTLIVGISGPFYSAHALQVLHMSYRQLALWSLLGSGISIVAQPLWGRFLDGGRRVPAMIGCGLICAVLPLLWVLATPDQLGYVWVDGVANGLFWSGFNLGLTHLLLQLCPPGSGRRGLGRYTLVTGLASGLSALSGGWMMSHDWHLPLQGAPLLFFLTAVGRLGCWLWLITLIQRWEPLPVAAPQPEPVASAG